MSHWKLFFKSSLSEKQLFAEALTWLILAKAAISLFPFKQIAARLGTQEASTILKRSVSDSEKRTIAQIARVVERSAVHCPGQFLCLPKAIAAKMMLRRRNIANTLSLGLQNPSDTDLKAHAWLCAGQHFVTGQSEYKDYKVIVSFTDDLKQQCRPQI